MFMSPVQLKLTRFVAWVFLLSRLAHAIAAGVDGLDTFESLSTDAVVMLLSIETLCLTNVVKRHQDFIKGISTSLNDIVDGT